jgi:hypothetical protein
MHKNILEDILEMRSGYTILENNKKFSCFFADLNFLDKYPILNDESLSKAKRMRQFFKESSNSDFKKFLKYILETQNITEDNRNYLKNILASFTKVSNDSLLNKEIKTEDESLNDLVDESKEHFKNDRLQIALEKIWDAFERVKTILDNDKKAGSNKLIEIMSTDLDYSILEDEFKALTKIGNNYTIRHHETNKKEIKDTYTKEYLFYRMLSLVNLAVLQINKNKEYIIEDKNE